MGKQGFTEMNTPIDKFTEAVEEALDAFHADVRDVWLEIAETGQHPDVVWHQLRAYYIDAINAAHQAAVDEAVRAARVEENESLLSVAEHEIELPNHCHMHTNYMTICHACKKRKWYGEISKDWQRIIKVRLAELGGTHE